ncbi:MAG TPA: 2-dehydropantoate 2-reductase N-terminal domain-containing protein, partial [Acidimicrobiales bacterium]|nr:2-dehydropantoate 2-reductase N-terminal domain-containing protein [Acidimicrobiales bacterium]
MSSEPPPPPRPLPPSTVVVIGSGAIGGYFGFALERAGHRVVLCARRPFDQLTVETEGRRMTVMGPVITDPGECPAADWVVLATKGHQTAGAAPWLSAACREAAAVLVLQNGVEHRERVSGFTGGVPVVPAVVLCGAEVVEPGRVRHHGHSAITVPDTELGRATAELFAGGPATVTLSSDFERDLWLKLVQNVTGGPLTAITGRRLEVMSQPEIAGLAVELAVETAAVARGCGVDLSDEVATAVVDGF